MVDLEDAFKEEELGREKSARKNEDRVPILSDRSISSSEASSFADS